MDWDFEKPFIHRIHVQPDDIVRMQHVNNARYLEYLELTAWEHTHHLGMSWDIYERLGVGVVAHRTEIDYLRAAVLGDCLLVATWCSGNDGRLRLRRHYQIIREDDEATLLRAQTLWISVDLKSGRPRRMPPEFVEAYRPVADAPPFPT